METRSHRTEEDKKEATVVLLLDVKMSFTGLKLRTKHTISINCR